MKGRHQGGDVSGRKLNVLLGQDPDDTNFMDPNNHHFFYSVKKRADEIQPGDSRLRKPKPAGNVGATRRSRRVELANPERKKLDEESVKKIS